MAKLVAIGLGNLSNAGKPVRTSLSLVEESYGLALNNETGEYGFQFTATDDGRGTGSQFIPLDDAEDFCNMLESFEDISSLRERTVSGNPVEIARATMALVVDKDGNEDGRVSFRTANGQGMKPTRLNHAEIPAIVAHIRGRLESSRATVAQVVAKAKADAKKA